MTQQTATKTITLNLEAIMTTRAVFTKTVVVPADMTADEESAYMDRLFRDTDGGDFTPVDDGFGGSWDKGKCTAFVAGEEVEPEGVLVRDAEGNLIEAD